MALTEFLARFKPTNEARQSTIEVIEGVKIKHTQVRGKSEPALTAFSVKIPTSTGEIIKRPICIGDEVGLPINKGDSVEVFVSAEPVYPRLTALKDFDKFRIIELGIKDVKSISPSRGEWVVDTISCKGDPGLTDLGLSPNDKQIRFSSYGFNNKFTELKHKSPTGPRIVFEQNNILSEPAKPLQLFRNTAAPKASA